MCPVTSRFTKLFYCERANIAHIQSEDTLVGVWEMARFEKKEDHEIKRIEGRIAKLRYHKG